jgi:uracil phosphoribosyltransferase
MEESRLIVSKSGPLSFGKILIQRDEETCQPTLFYSKFPPNMTSQSTLLPQNTSKARLADIDTCSLGVMILEPMLATGGSACAAIDVIKAQGVPEENIIFVNVLASQVGVERLFSRFPGIRLVTAAVDEHLTPTK